jgi:ATP-dependent RNA helicase DeaD
MDNPFLALGLDENLVKAVTDLGFEQPSEIQQKAIPHLLQDQSDLVALAQTGTGKTAAFSLPLLYHIQPTQKHIQAVVLSPTRELALQIAQDIKNLSKYLPKINVTTIYGGASIEQQAREIRRGAHIVVATPGRLVDMLKRRMVRLDQVGTCVLDEADEMLNMGFKDDLDTILSTCPEDRNTWLFSATMPPEVSRIAKEYMQTTHEITCGTKNKGSDNVQHFYALVNPYNRYNALKRMIDNEQSSMFGIIFCRTRSETQDVAEKLINDGYNAGALHGDLSQNQRDVVMNHFRKRNIQFLVATDVAARGIDVDEVTHVINYKLPDQIESYTHRSGRTGRAGKKGVSFAICTPNEERSIRSIERIIKKKFTKITLPSAGDVAKNKLISVSEKLRDIEINDELVNKYFDYFEEEFGHLTKEDVLKKFITLEMEQFLKNVSEEDINYQGRSSAGSQSSKSRRYHLNIGEKDGLKDWTDLKDYIKEITGLKKDDVFRVDLMNTFSFFSIDKQFEESVISSFNNIEYNGRQVKLELTKEKGSRGGRGGGGGRGRGGRSSDSRRRFSGGDRDRRGGGGGRRDSNHRRRRRG